MSDLSAEQPTGAEVAVTDAMVESADQVIDQIDEARVNEEWELTLDVIRAMLTAALSVSPLLERNKKLTEENERLRAELDAERHLVGIAASIKQMYADALDDVAAPSPSSKGEQ